jgi:type IV secretory pathway VirB2 component (pilin)
MGAIGGTSAAMSSLGPVLGGVAAGAAVVGVAAMGMEKIEFFWYLRRISWLALLGYFVGAFAYILEVQMMG